MTVNIHLWSTHIDRHAEGGDLPSSYDACLAHATPNASATRACFQLQLFVQRKQSSYSGQETASRVVVNRETTQRGKKGLPEDSQTPRTIRRKSH